MSDPIRIARTALLLVLSLLLGPRVAEVEGYPAPNGIGDGWGCMDDDRLQETIKGYERTISEIPDKAIPYTNLGWCHYLKGDFSKSIKYSGKALDLEPGSAVARFNTALAYLRLGRAQHARALYGMMKRYCDRKGIAVDPQTVEDLADLVRRGVRADSATAILRDIFGMAGAEGTIHPTVHRR